VVETSLVHQRDHREQLVLTVSLDNATASAALSCLRKRRSWRTAQCSTTPYRDPEAAFLSRAKRLPVCSMSQNRSRARHSSLSAAPRGRTRQPCLTASGVT
jgi:hypothetical protein